MFLSVLIQKHLYSIFMVGSEFSFVILGVTFAMVIHEVRFQVLWKSFLKTRTSADIDQCLGLIVEGVNSRFRWNVFRPISPNVHFPWDGHVFTPIDRLHKLPLEIFPQNLFNGSSSPSLSYELVSFCRVLCARACSVLTGLNAVDSCLKTPSLYQNRMSVID